MKAVTVHQIKNELKHKSQDELYEYILHLAKFKKENKELLTYLLFEREYEQGYIDAIKLEIDAQFDTINTTSFYFIKKSVRKILRMTKKFIRYSKKPETEAELLIHFCEKLQRFRPNIKRNKSMLNLYSRQLILIKKAVSKLHEDEQYDFLKNVEDLEIA